MPRLVRKYDIREWDYDRGERIPLPRDQQHECDRCTARHCIIFEVQLDADDPERPGGVVEVGSGCFKRVRDGWTPSPAELRAAESDFDRAHRAMIAERVRAEVLRLVPRAREILEAVAPPRLLRTDGAGRLSRETWGWATTDRPPPHLPLDNPREFGFYPVQSSWDRQRPVEERRAEFLRGLDSTKAALAAIAATREFNVPKSIRADVRERVRDLLVQGGQ